MKFCDKKTLFIIVLLALFALYCYSNQVIETFQQTFTGCDQVPNSYGCSGCTNVITTSGVRCKWDINSKQYPGAETHCNSFDGIQYPSQCPTTKLNSQ